MKLSYLPLASVLLFSYASHAQETDRIPEIEVDFDIPGSEVTDFLGDGGIDFDDGDAEATGMKRWFEKWPADLVVAPIPGRSPQLGWTLALAGGYFIQEQSAEPDQPKSIVGGFAMWAENGSYIYGGGASLHLMDNRLRVKGGAAYADVTYRYYGLGDGQNQLPFNIDVIQKMPLYAAQASWNFWKNLFVGVGYFGGEVDTSFKITFENPNLPDSIVLDIGAFTIPFEWDTRDHELFPRDGWLIDGRATYYRDSAGGDIDADVYKVAFNNYRPIGENNVLASRLYFRGTEDNVPFFLLSTFGGSKDLRGYPSGRYRDRLMYALQTEYRWQVNNKWIVTGFVGVGEVAAEFSEFGDDFLPAAGVGVRYVVSDKHRVSLSFDVAQGKHDPEFYFGINEAF